MNNIMAKEFIEVIGPYERPMVILYNESNISEEEVDKLIKSGKYKYSDDIILTTKEQYLSVRGKV